MANVNELLTNVQTSIERLLKNNFSNIDKDLALSKIRDLYEAVQNISAEIKIIEAPKPQPTIVSATTSSIQLQAKTEEPKVQTNEKSESLNEVLTTNKKVELAEKLEHSPIADLKAAISFNDRFSFTQHLFAGNADVFKTTIDSINACQDFADAEKIIAEIKNEKWLENIDVADFFMELIRRRFGVMK